MNSYHRLVGDDTNKSRQESQSGAHSTSYRHNALQLPIRLAMTIFLEYDCRLYNNLSINRQLVEHPAVIPAGRNPNAELKEPV